MFRTVKVKNPNRVPRGSKTSKVEHKTQKMETDCLIKNMDFGSKFLKRLHKVKTIEACYENCKNVTGWCF